MVDDCRLRVNRVGLTSNFGHAAAPELSDAVCHVWTHCSVAQLRSQDYGI
jgi:hypothetical protein